MSKSFFITGTDTDAGKTWATIALMHYFKNKGLSVVGMKPVAAGCEFVSHMEKSESKQLFPRYDNKDTGSTDFT